MTSQDCIHYITSALFLTSDPLYTTWHTLYLWHHSHCNYDKTYYVFDIILRVYDISHGEWMTTQRLYLTWYPMYLCNQTHLIVVITPYVCMKSYSLHVWQHRHFIWHHIHSCWQDTIVCISWHTLCLWHHIYYIWCHPYCVYDYLSSMSDLKPIKTSISSTL